VKKAFLSALLAAFAAAPSAAGADIVFLSDFGLTDDSVALCKAAMLNVFPQARITDMTHNVEPFNIRLASFLLAGQAAMWPRGTVFAAVVDPGVGTARKAIALETETGQFFVGPDNGIFTLPVLRFGLRRAVALENGEFFRQPVSATFHGRDVFSPVAARLAMDDSVFARLGPPVKPAMSSWKQASFDGREFSGSAVHAEAPYGNIWTDIGEESVARSGLVAGSTVAVTSRGRSLEAVFVRAFGDAGEGAPLAYINSRGLLALAVNRGDFARLSGMKTGDEITIRLPDPALIDMEKAPHGGIVFDIRYAGPDNFTGKTVYPAAKCYLRKPAADALAKAAALAAPNRLCVLDCYRPLSVQRKFWALVPDERFVADPAKGSRHNRGMAVDAALCDGSGKWLELPTKFDDFSERAARDWSGASPAAATNRKALEDAMRGAGFSGLPSEWWHFDYPGWQSMPVMDIPFSE